MATILNADIQVDFLADNRQKRLSWLGGTNDTYTMNEVYSAMATLLDETTTIDDGTCFSAETPVEYTIGKIDTGDTEPWYITFDLMEHITGGALRTSGWTRSQDSNAGIICVQVDSGGDIVAGDAGEDIVHSDGDVGTLLEFIDTGGAVDYCIIRPDTNTITNSFDAASGDDLTCNTHVADVLESDGVATTGEQIWANLYSLGTIDANVHLYAYQGEVANDGDRVRIFSWNDSTQDWYNNGHIDTVIALKDITASTWSIVDNGYITVFARKYGDLFASFEVECSTTSGGRNPIPLQSAADLDNATGIKIVSTGAFSGGPFFVGEIISEAVSLARGIVTGQVDNTSISYIPIDDPQIAFFSQTAQLITGASSGAEATSSADAEAGPATSAWFDQTTTPIIEFTHTNADIDDNAAEENYGIVIDCKSNPLTEVYEWIKYATRNGEVTNALDGINGECYIGAEVYLAWSGSITDTMSEGGDVTQAGSNATGIIIAIDPTDKVMLLRDTRGTFNTSGVVTDNDNNGYVTPDSAAVTFAAKTSSPLGTFAGGTFFGARGVLLINYADADANSFILTPTEGGTVERPPSITFTVTNLDGGAATSNLHDRVSIFRLTGSGEDINKNEYTCAGGEAVGGNTLETSAISQDTPGKTAGGVLILIDTSDNGKEYKLRFASWSGSIFTLEELTGTTDSHTTTSQVNHSGQTFLTDVKRGDLVTTANGSSHVKTINSDTQLELETADCVMADALAYEINTSPIVVANDDKVYVPFMDRVATGVSESVGITYSSTIYYRAKVRNTRASTKIKPFSVDSSTSGTDQSIATIRQEDTIIN